jgi:hypothetical protein
MPADPPTVRDVADLTSIIRRLLDPTPVITDPPAGLEHSPASMAQGG